MSSISKIKTNDITYDVEDTSKQGLLIPGENITIENNVISAQNSYTLPVASNNTLGGVKVGDNLSIDSLGKLSSKNFNIMLKNVSGTVPTEVQSGDKYYNPTTNKIYTYVANTWDSGSTPEKGINYINQENNKIYLYDGTTLKPPTEPMKCYFIETRTEYQEVNTITDTIREVYSNVKNNIPFGAYTTIPRYVYLAGNAMSFTLYMTDIENNVVNGTGTVNLRFSNTIYPSTSLQNYLHMGVLVVTLNIVNDEVDSRTQSTPYIGPVLRPYQNNSDFLHSTEALDIDNRRSYVPTRDFHPSTKKYVDDTIKNKTLLLNYDAGDYDYTYLVAENTFSTSLPSTELKRTSSESNYNMDYTYTSAQTIGPGTKFIFNLALMAGSNAVTSQDIALTISIRRSSSALVSINKTLSIPWTSGTTADTTVLNFRLPFDFELEEPLNIQNGDIFRLTIDYRYVNNMTGYLYSSATDPTYVEQYSTGVSANDVYDKINNVAYSQHEINTTIPDIVQYSTVPTAGSNNEGKIIQYTGTTDSTYTNGYFYQCISDGAVTPTYSWENINVQASPSVYKDTFYWDGTDTADNRTMFEKIWSLLQQGKHVNLYLPSGVGGRKFNVGYEVYNNYLYLDINFIWLGKLYYYELRVASFNNGVISSLATLNTSLFNVRGIATNYDTNVYINEFSVLPVNNTRAFTPTSDYHPSTKKYVDDSIQNVYVACGLPAYSSSSTYAVGDYVYKDNTVYVCSTAISTAEAWTVAHWTVSNLKAYLQSELVGNALGGSY